jgi:hypothetical protein
MEAPVGYDLQETKEEKTCNGFFLKIYIFSKCAAIFYKIFTSRKVGGEKLVSWKIFIRPPTFVQRRRVSKKKSDKLKIQSKCPLADQL